MDGQFRWLEVGRLNLPAEDRWYLVAVTLARRKQDPAGDEIANELRNKPLVCVVPLLPQLLKLIHGRRDLVQLPCAGIEPEDLAIGGRQEHVAKRTDNEQFHRPPEEPLPVSQQIRCAGLPKVHRQLIPSYTHSGELSLNVHGEMPTNSVLFRLLKNALESLEILQCLA